MTVAREKNAMSNIEGTFGKHGYKETVLTSSLSNARVQDKRRLYLCGGETVARDVDHVCRKT